MFINRLFVVIYLGTQICTSSQGTGALPDVHLQVWKMKGVKQCSRMGELIGVTVRQESIQIVVYNSCSLATFEELP